MSDLGYYTLKEIREDQALFDDDFGAWLERHGVDFGEGFTPLYLTTDDCQIGAESVNLNALKLAIRRLISLAEDDALDYH